MNHGIIPTTRKPPDAMQAEMPLHPKAVQKPKSDAAVWLGISTDHRRLFEALQDGWLRPVKQNGLLAGIGAHVVEQTASPSKHPIPVGIQFDLAKLPHLDNVPMFRENHWDSCPLTTVRPETIAMFWPGALPTFAIHKILVANNKDQAHLAKLTQAVSNIALPKGRLAVAPDFLKEPRTEIAPPKNTDSQLSVPDDADAKLGAMSMAVWAVPRMAPWFDLLAASLSPNHANIRQLARTVNATWWCIPPWKQISADWMPSNINDGLWEAAIAIFANHSPDAGINPVSIAEQIAKRASRFGGTQNINSWLKSTTDILHSRTTIQIDGWHKCPVGLAIQLVLTRSEPAAFKTWMKTPLPPIAAWSGAALCGLLNGYKRLGTRFRGEDPFQHEILSVLALLECDTSQLRKTNWPSIFPSEMKWTQTENTFVLSWGENKVCCKQAKERNAWYEADYQDHQIRDAALSAAQNAGWDKCIQKMFRFPEGQFPLSGTGTMNMLSGTDKQQTMEVRGEVRLLLRDNDKLHESHSLDAEQFRRHVLLERGILPSPPLSPHGVDLITYREIPGLITVLDFLDTQEEEDLVQIIDRSEWEENKSPNKLIRRVQHYGWRYDYRKRKVDASMKIGPLPDWANCIAEKLVARGLVQHRPDQLIVNEYQGNQGISKHIDSSDFADGIAMISLLEAWEMIFHAPKDENRRKIKVAKIPLMLERRSATILTGDARFLWQHEIPKRKSEPARNGSTERIPRQRRISLTFRAVIQ